MDYQQLLERYKPLLRQHWLPITLGLSGLLLIGYGLISFLGSSSTGSDVVFEQASESEEGLGKDITVDIEGAVVKPGVYTLASGSRIQNLLIAAGGLSLQADREWVAKSLNLAAKLSDGAKVYIPEVGSQKSQVSVGTQQVTSSGLININTASEGELDTLPGVGPVIAQKIIQGRPYGSVEELVAKKILSNKVFLQVKEKVTVY